MATNTQHGDGSDGDEEPETTYDAYSDFSYVTETNARIINGAVGAYARLRAAHVESDHVPHNLAQDARARITEAAILVETEARQDAETELPDDWTGRDGWRQRFEAVELAERCPGWVNEFVQSIRLIAFELGYLKSGSTDTVEDDDPIEAETDAMFDDL